MRQHLARLTRRTCCSFSCIRAFSCRSTCSRWLLAAAMWMACRNRVLENGLHTSSTPCSLMGVSSCSAAAALTRNTTPASVFSTAVAHRSWPNSSGRGALTTISSKSDSSIRRRASAPLGTMRGRVYPNSVRRAHRYSLELAPALTIRARPILLAPFLHACAWYYIALK